MSSKPPRPWPLNPLVPCACVLAPSSTLGARRADDVLEGFESTPPYACLEAVQCGTGTVGGCDLEAADAHGVGVTPYLLLTNRLPVMVDKDDEKAAGDSLHAWEAALLRRVRRTGPRNLAPLSRASVSSPSRAVRSARGAVTHADEITMCSKTAMA